MQLKKLSEHNRLLLASLLVGVLSGCAAVLLDYLIESLASLVRSSMESSTAFNWQLLLLPGLGMLLSLLLLRFVIKDNIGHGVTKVLLAVSRNESRIKAHNTWSSILTSAATIGLGGSVGAEAPIVYTGAAIGSNVGKLAGLSYRNITVLLGCGAAGAVAGIFKAPLAGVLFTMEVLMFNISMNSLLPLLLSSISATVISYIFRGQTPIFGCALAPFSMGNIPYYLILGVGAGLFSLYFTNGTLWLEDKLGKMRNAYLKWLLCALGLGLLIFLFPPLYGQGYGFLTSLLSGVEPSFEGSTPLSFITISPWGVPLMLLLILVFKMLAMTLTNSGGGVGGTFGPTLFSGAMLGFILSRCFNLLGAGVSEQNFVLVGMAALMASVMQAPMTAIFLIAEISGGYALLLPLILCSTVAFGTARLFEKYSIYTKRIAQSGDLLTHDADKAAMTLMDTNKLIRDKYPKLQIDATLRQIVETISTSDAAVLAVIDSQGRFQGMIDLDSIRSYLFSSDKYDSIHVYNLMSNPAEIILFGEKMDSVMRKFDKSGAWRLPVVDDKKKYLGFISKSRLLTAYRQELREISADD